MIGTLLGNRYELLEKIGEGGMAIVYKAKCRLLDRYVAVKVLKEQYSNDRDFVEKFKNEATAAASLSHNNIVNIYDVGSENSINYIVMEYVSGKTLKRIITENIRLSYPRTINIAIQIASALECAHKNNLIHRDIKPHNILVTEDGIAKVADFGIAKVANSMTITNSNEVIGSAHYFSPEQAKGGFVDCTTDIYSLGIVMYEMVTGKVPYDADSAVSVAIKHIQEAVVPPKQIIWDIPENLNRLILKAIEKETIKRYQSAKEILIDLNKIKENANFEIKLSTLEDDYTKVMAPVMIIDKNKNNTNTNNKNKNKYEEDEDEEDEEIDSKNMKRSTKIILIALVCIGAIIIGVSAGKLFSFFNNPKPAANPVINIESKITVPELIGKTNVEAKKIVEDLKLKYVIAEYAFDDKPADTIIECNKKAGETVEKDFSIRVTLSKGKQVLKVMDLTGMPETTAGDAIKSGDFVLGTVTKDYSDSVAEGLVIGQKPDPDTEYEKDGKVDLVISKGPKVIPVIVPRLTGKTIEEARAILEAKGLKLGKQTSFKPDDSVSEDQNGEIFLQSKTEGSSVTKGTVITVSYYKFPIENEG